MSIIALAELHPTQGNTDSLVRALLAALDAVHAQDGCELYAVHEAKEKVVILEKWRDRESLDAHRQGEPLARLRKAMDGLVADKRAEILIAQPTGNPASAL